MRGFVAVVALGVLAGTSPGHAEAPAVAAAGASARQAPQPKPTPAPATQAPATPAPQAPTAPAPAQPEPPKPFPAGAKVAYVVLQRIANESADGRVATTRIQALQQKKAAELNEKNKELQGLQQKLEKEGPVMAVSAQADLQKRIEKLNVDIQRFTQDAQAEVTELQQQLQDEFQQRLDPVIRAVAEEKGLQFIFNGPDAGLVFADPSLDITADVIRKLDASSSKPAPKPKPPGR
jgi:Skp family chaperone for outer membrane proteins